MQTSAPSVGKGGTERGGLASKWEGERYLFKLFLFTSAQSILGATFLAFIVISSVADVPGCPKPIQQVAVQDNFNLDKVGMLRFDQSILQSRIIP